ncbi:MAG: hypothetical protein ABFS41_09090 [Myxococcota bacterium]
MRFAGSLSLLLLCSTPLAVNAADGEVGGRARAPSPGQPLPVEEGRIVFVGLERSGGYGWADRRDGGGPEIRIEGAREIRVLPDGTLEVVLDAADRDEE